MEKISVFFNHAVAVAVMSLLCMCGHAQTSLMALMEKVRAGDAAAQYELGVNCLLGEGVPQDTVKAIKYLTMSADNGYAPAQFALGNAYRDGDGVEKNIETAMDYYEKAANQGHAESMTALAEAYGDYKNPRWSSTKRDEWKKKAAEAGDDAAKLSYALSLMGSYGSTDKQKEGMKMLNDLLERGNTDAMVEMGHAYFDGNKGIKMNRVEAVKWYRKAAEAGNARGMMCMATCYRDGKGAPIKPEEMCSWFGKAAEAGNKNGMYFYGKCLWKGNGCESDLDAAWSWFSKGADMDEDRCIAAMGEWLLTGVNGKKDVPTAIKYLNKAIELKNGTASTLLGKCYEDGVGVPKSEEKAREMWKLSYRYGDRAGAELYARSLERYAQEKAHNATKDEDYREAERAADEATHIWHDIVRWHDENYPLPLKPNPDTGDYETDDTLTY